VPAETENVRSQLASSGPAAGSAREIAACDSDEKINEPPATSGVWPIGSDRLASRRLETSEVLPAGSVAVAEIIGLSTGGL
jgi:hypothetical protein